MKTSPVSEAIKNRRSVRKFMQRQIPHEAVISIIEAASHAPSGHNNQPWRFVVIREKQAVEKMAGFTSYGNIIRGADVLIAVFLDKNHSYHRDKDFMAIGACIQNMLLCAQEFAIGSVWLGEILKSGDAIVDYLGLDRSKELAAVIALGYPDGKPKNPGREPVGALIMKEV